jgi:ATP-binding cassette subfamily B protein
LQESSLVLWNGGAMGRLITAVRARWRAGEGRRALVPLALEVAPGLSALLGLAILAASALPVLFTLAVGRVVAAVGASLGGDTHAHLGRAVGVAGVVFVTTHATGPLVAALADPIGLRINVRLRQRVIDVVGRPAGVEHLEDPALLDLVAQSKGIGPGQFQPGSAFVGLANIVARRLQMLGSAVLLARYSLPLALVVVTGGYVILVRLRSELIRDVTMMKDSTELLRRADYVRDLVVGPQASKEVRVFGLAGWVVERFVGEWHHAMADVWKRRGQGNGWSGLAMVVGGICSAVGYGFIARAAARGEITIAELAVLLQAVTGAANFSIDDNDLSLDWGAAAVPSVAALEREVTALVAAEPHGVVAVPPAAPEQRIRFESVAFRYPGRDDDVYRDLDLDLVAGQSLAVVGVNGAGKTTLVKLLAGLRRPTAGRITVDGIDLTDLDVRQWQRRVAAIFQDFARYELSAHDNVAFGGIERGDDRDAVIRAAARAGARPFVDDLPAAWDTVLSRKYTDGVDLSGGQWQRLALARALFAVEAGAKVLILDEPTANLDVRAEAELFDRFLELTAGVTTILVSHRFSTVRRADRICVLDAGRVVEIGSHAELLSLGGQYAHMFTLQAARFTEEVGG